ncbi:MAG: T9SS type A sorting domain-containing protein [Candidatus Eisenbacteria bacterium]
MKRVLTAALLFGALLALAIPAFGQAPREDVIWARSTEGVPVTLDGALNEPAWAVAESIQINWGESSGIPGSGWKLELGRLPKDKTRATLKFLVVNNQLFMAAVVPDSSIGGGPDFNRFDGFLMCMKDHGLPGFPKPPAEYLYSWWYPECPDSMAPGKEPGFIGSWGVFPPCGTRDSTDIANWDAAIVVQGLTNSDAVIDAGYTVEMKFDLTAMGYDVTAQEGDVVEWNISIYDADWFWPINALKVTGNRTWWQGPWGNAAIYNEVRIHARPDVTISSGPVPDILPELYIPNGVAYTPPVIDGVLDEDVWADIPSFDIRWDDDSLRMTYPAVGPYRAGQFQATVNGGTAEVTDPSDASVRIFHSGDTLYFGFDVRDKVVQYHADFNRWDGFLIGFDDRGVIGPDSNFVSRRLSFQVGSGGTVLAADYLPFLMDSLSGARLGLALKGGTTVDTLGLQADSGYTAELAIDLTKLGYPTGLGDRAVFFGINLLDGDSFTPSSDSYGIRTWWYREYDGTCCPVWGYLDPAVWYVDVAGPISPSLPRLVQNYPNPFKGTTTLRYMLPVESEVTLEVFDARGRLVDRKNLGTQGAGMRYLDYPGTGKNTGVYFYRLHVKNPATGDVGRTLTGKMTLVR